jgi:hypothetical protein
LVTTTVRSHAYKFFTPDGSVLDERIDSFIASQRSDPFYKESFTAAPGPAKAAGIGIAITEAERIAIDRGEIVVEPEAKSETASIGPGTIQPSMSEFDEMIASGKVKVG